MVNLESVIAPNSDSWLSVVFERIKNIRANDFERTRELTWNNIHRPMSFMMTGVKPNIRNELEHVIKEYSTTTA